MDKKLIYRYFAVACIVLGALSCVKEELPSRDEPVGDGESEISFGITHRSLSNASLGGTRSETGDAIGEIDDIFVVWYRENGTLAGSCYVPHDRLTVNEAERDTRPDGTPIPPDGETSTRHAEFKCTLPYGRYRIYAAVNMGDLTNDARIGTERDFRNIRLEWNGTKIVDNDQMSGYFKVEGEDPADSVAVIDRPNLRLHAWVRRAVSKVTVAFDARKLNENIYIYIQSARIKDIPRSCPLVDTNRPSSDEELWEDGDTILYGRGDDHTQWLRIACGRGANQYGSHANDAPSLFFFENMQGKHPDKHQYQNFDRKDNVPYGTYVEVKGYYVNNSMDNPSYGNIVYRCMLGKNMEDDFDSERNAHYRLTLVFNKDANDVDWHIDYDYVPKPPEIVVPTPMYISYLSNRSLEVPATVYYDNSLASVKSLRADIIENEWGYPDHKYYGRETSPSLKNGFLSLEYSGHTSVDRNKVYAGSKVFSVPESMTDDACVYRFSVYTRPMSLGSGYSGNNYYVGRRRTAKVKLTATVTNKLTGADFEVLDTVEIIQVRRLVNPTGIWRRGNSTKEFRVALKNTSSNPTVADVFEDVVSEGPWTARIVEGADWIRIKDTESDTWDVVPVTGGTGSKVVFDYKPGSEYSHGVRFGKLEVKFHNNTCTHVILVSQGLGPVEIGGRKWHMTNVRYCGVDEENPLLEGSMFKFGNSEVAFRAKNNLKPGYGFRENGFYKSYEVYDAAGREASAVFGDVPAKLGGFTDAGMKRADAVGPSHVATLADWNSITDIDRYTRYYGILYGDECDGTLDMNTQTNTYTEVGDKKGMRGCFVYDNATGVHLFFPIGNTGNGRRQYYDGTFLWNGDQAAIGSLKYADRSSEMKDPDDNPRGRPCLYALYREPGAIYWYERKADNGCYAFDINYFTFGFESYNTTRVWSAGNSPYPTQYVPQSDICLLRRVYD